jgi:hypothetical protein
VLLLMTASSAQSSGGSYVIDGGTAPERAQISAALNASSFDWSLVPMRVQFHVSPGSESCSAPGQIWVDANLLDSGRFSWGVVQHEYAHQVDFFLLTDADRVELLRLLGGQTWWDSPYAAVPHRQLGAERFASTLAWSYWPSNNNAMRPSSPGDESAAMAPASFRAVLQRILGLHASTALRLPVVAQHTGKDGRRWSATNTGIPRRTPSISVANDQTLRPNALRQSCG